MCFCIFNVTKSTKIMSREIKFRAIPINTNHFEYGYLFYNKSMPGIFQPGIGSLVCIEGSEGQYTGTTNKKGVEIYEGDIIQCNNQNCVVVFGKRTCGFGYHVKYNTSWNVIDKFYRLSTKDVVIGNVKQNPELLIQSQPVKR